MSENENKPEVTSAPRAGYGEVHTAINTPMKDRVDPTPNIKRELTEEDVSKSGYMTVYLGSSKVSQMKAREIISEWLKVTSIQAMALEGNASASQLTKAQTEWEEYVATAMPDLDPKQAMQEAAGLYKFMSEIQDEIKVRSKVMFEPDITNRCNRGSNFLTPDVIGKKPSTSTKGFTTAQIMRRSALRASGETLDWDVLLRNSFVSLTFNRPSKLEIGSLIADIQRTVRGYVRSVNHNSAVIARIASIKVIWDFLSKRITNSSVSDVGDFEQLIKVIRLTDMDTLVIALMESFCTRGVPLELRCLAENCGWHQFGQVDPSSMVQRRPSIETPEESAIFANIINGKAKYTVEETLAMSRASTYGLESNRVYNADRSIYLTIDPPTLEEAFNTFDYFLGRINPRLAEIRSKIVDPEEAETQMSVALNELGSTEFIHWVSGFGSAPTPGTDENEIVIRRYEQQDQAEFNKGLMDVIVDDEIINKELARFILNKTPFMSRTFVGVRNYECPKCSKNSAEAQETQLGYTPIDPIMSFFILTQLSLMERLVAASEANSAALSD